MRDLFHIRIFTDVRTLDIGIVTKLTVVPGIQTVYDEVDLEDMAWSDALAAYTYQCPCGDLFQITRSELNAGEEIARCPSCSLVIRVLYDPDDLESALAAGSAFDRWPQTIKCLVPRH